MINIHQPSVALGNLVDLHELSSQTEMDFNINYSFSTIKAFRSFLRNLKDNAFRCSNGGTPVMSGTVEVITISIDITNPEILQYLSEIQAYQRSSEYTFITSLYFNVDHTFKFLHQLEEVFETYIGMSRNTYTTLNFRVSNDFNIEECLKITGYFTAYSYLNRRIPVFSVDLPTKIDNKTYRRFYHSIFRRVNIMPYSSKGCAQCPHRNVIKDNKVYFCDLIRFSEIADFNHYKESKAVKRNSFWLTFTQFMNSFRIWNLKKCRKEPNLSGCFLFNKYVNSIYNDLGTQNYPDFMEKLSGRQSGDNNNQQRPQNHQDIKCGPFDESSTNSK